MVLATTAAPDHGPAFSGHGCATPRLLLCRSPPAEKALPLGLLQTACTALFDMEGDGEPRGEGELLELFVSGPDRTCFATCLLSSLNILGNIQVGCTWRAG
jgi:hypothetical protein